MLSWSRGFLAFVLVVVAARGCGRCGFRAFRTQKAGAGECQHHSCFALRDSVVRVGATTACSVKHYTEVLPGTLRPQVTLVSRAYGYARSSGEHIFSTAPAKGAFFKSEVLALLLDRSWVPGFSHLFGALVCFFLGRLRFKIGF